MVKTPALAAEATVVLLPPGRTCSRSTASPHCASSRQARVPAIPPIGCMTLRMWWDSLERTCAQHTFASAAHGWCSMVHRWSGHGARRRAETDTAFAQKHVFGERAALQTRTPVERCADHQSTSFCFFGCIIAACTVICFQIGAEAHRGKTIQQERESVQGAGFPIPSPAHLLISCPFQCIVRRQCRGQWMMKYAYPLVAGCHHVDSGGIAGLVW